MLVFDDCQASAVSAIIEALSVANLHWAITNREDAPPLAWRTVSWNGRPVRAMGGLTLAADSSMKELGKPDLIFVPAIRSDDSQSMQKSVQRLSEQWGAVLRDHHRRNRYVAANCSATFLLAEAGLLDGRTATTSWWLSRSFRSCYPRVRLLPEMLVTKDTRILCAAGFSACFNLGLEIVAEFLGPRAVLSCARVMLIDVNRATQLPYADLQAQIEHGDDLVLRAQTILLSNLTRSMHLENLADRLRVSSRTLGRRFRTAIGETPLVFRQNARIERAKRLLETTNISFDTIAHRVGYEDASSFRRLFARATGTSPRDYRRRFRTRERWEAVGDPSRKD
ncbi:MAG TPA: helix-turn-helix domain-containing protein [Vicinamibacterales bacterium]